MLELQQKEDMQKEQLNIFLEDQQKQLEDMMHKMQSKDPTKQLEIKRLKHSEKLKYDSMVNSGQIKGDKHSKKKWQK